MKLLLTLSYLGTRYFGYQVQKNGPTVQSELNAAALALFGYPCDIVGCSRTDSGVHAKMFCATVSRKGTDELSTAIPLAGIPKAFNAHLPNDISVYDAAWVPAEFHPRYGVRSKEYIYRIYNRPIRSPFEEGLSCHFPKPLDLEKMQKAASFMIGTHDFTSFMATGSKIEDATRTVLSAEVTKEGDVITFRVCADGFLYNMVRIMAGTLVGAGEGKIAPEEIREIIDARDRKRAGKTMPACGLFLNRVNY